MTLASGRSSSTVVALAALVAALSIATHAGAASCGGAVACRLLAPLAVAKPTQLERKGKAAFRKARCQLCHVDKLRTGPNVARVLHTEPAPLYSDLLLHDMGPALAGGVAHGEATGSEFRSAPLWGVGRSASYLHDGRAPTLEAAIVAHGGEATASRDRYLALSDFERAALVAFLESL
jgi:CxxC motif-containing protein (DUF1111 family)